MCYCIYIVYTIHGCCWLRIEIESLGSVESNSWWGLITIMSNSKLRALTWWRKWAKKDWAVAAVGFSVIVFLFTLMSNSWRHDSKVNHPFDHDRIPDLVDLTLSHNAKDRGARTWSHLYTFSSHFHAFFTLTTNSLTIFICF